MVIKLIKKIAERVGGAKAKAENTRGSGKAQPAEKRDTGRGSARSNSGGAAKRKGAASRSGGKKSSAEVWRPGQSASGRQEGARSGGRRPRGAASGGSRNGSGNRSGRRRPRRDETVLSQPGGDSPAGNRSQSKPAAEHSQSKPAVEQTPQPTEPKSPEKPWSQDDFKVESADGKTRFQDLKFPPEVLHALADLDFRYCTPIQAGVLQDIPENANIAGRAQTGTGKTAAFLLLTYAHFLKHPPQGERQKGRPRALVLAPTRELVIQIVKDADALSKYTGFRNLAVYGGTGYEAQERALAKGPVDLVAATPGRLLDFHNKRKIDLRGVEVLVIDEADRMLDMGFIPDVRRIIRSTPPKDKRRTLLFSATLSDDVMRLARQWMPDPQMVEIEPEHVAVDTVKQLVYLVKSNEKFKVLYNLLRRPNIGRVLIFANRRDQTERIAHELKRHGIDCAVLSGAVSQNRRMRVLEDFRSGKIQTVVATDVAGRGLHVDDINHVVNFDLPYEAEDYVHRIGRTGRAGSSGTAVSFACEDESFTIPEIEAFIGEELSCKYPEDVLLKELPRPQGAAYRKRPPERRGGGGGRGGRRDSRGSRGGSYGGKRRR